MRVVDATIRKEVKLIPEVAIRETEEGLIKPDERVGTSRRFVRYLPFWAWVYLRDDLGRAKTNLKSPIKTVSYLFKRLPDSAFLCPTTSLRKEQLISRSSPIKV